MTLGVHKLKTSLRISDFDWRAILMRLLVTGLLLAAVLKIGS